MFRLDVLPSGLTVLAQPDPDAQSVALGYFVRTGARDEDPRDLGASHFLEHLMFKGSDRVSARDLNAGFDALGANVNAFTSEETTVYHAASLPDTWPALLRLLSELMRPALREDEVLTERGVILEEIAMYADQPDARAFDELRERAWGAHPLGHNVLGTPETVGALSVDRLRANYEARYGTTRTTLVATGNFDYHALLGEAARLTGDWPRGHFTRELREHQFTGGLHVLNDPDLARAQFTLIAPGVRAADPHREAAVVLSDILGGDNGRLYWALVDTGLTDSADLSHTEFEETGTFEGGWTCDPDRAGRVLRAVRDLLQRAQDEGVTETEVRRARRKLAVGSALRAETPYSRLFHTGMDYLYLGRPLTPEEAVERYEAVTVDDVNALLRDRPFDRMQVLALGPLAETDLQG